MTHPDNSVQMSGDGESEEGVAVVPLIQFISIPADSLCVLHQSVKCRVRLTIAKTAARAITMIMLADGVDTLPNVVQPAEQAGTRSTLLMLSTVDTLDALDS